MVALGSAVKLLVVAVKVRLQKVIWPSSLWPGCAGSTPTLWPSTSIQTLTSPIALWVSLPVVVTEVRIEHSSVTEKVRSAVLEVRIFEHSRVTSLPGPNTSAFDAATVILSAGRVVVLLLVHDALSVALVVALWLVALVGAVRPDVPACGALPVRVPVALPSAAPVFVPAKP